IELTRALRRLEEERAALETERGLLAEYRRESERREAEAQAGLERARNNLAGERARIRGEAEELISGLRRESADLVREIRSQNKPRAALNELISTAGENLERLTPSSESEGQAADEVALKVGDQVEIGDIRGELLELEPDRAIIGRGSLRIEVAPNRLRRSRVPASTPRPAHSVIYDVSPDESGQLNLIGMRTNDALRRLEEFLDQSYLANRAEVRIVHGVGSGALRKAIHAYLEDSRYSASFREAEPHRGGAGATIVAMNL
ncbi:MAG: Smr/MutS family protein, partial [Candidatus Binataceae bacterium]